MKAQMFPEGQEWRCMKCDYTCDDSGPDYCPVCFGPMLRKVMQIRLDLPETSPFGEEPNT